MRQLIDIEPSAVGGGSRCLRLVPAPLTAGANFPNPPELSVVYVPGPIVNPFPAR
jgi:hypothetical protein